VPTCSPFSGSGGITPAGSFTYTDGDLKVTAGNTVTLANGTYCFKSVTLVGNSLLKVNGPVVVYLTDQADLSGGAVINTTNCAANLQILSSGTGAIKVSGGTQTFLTIYAPSAQVDVVGGGDLSGAIVGNSVKVTGGSNIHFDEALSNGTVTCGGGNPPINLAGGTVAFKRDSWTLVQN
jgi:hypothetical protein